MQNARSIIRQPICLTILLSVAVHAAVLITQRSRMTPAVPHIDTGISALCLSLVRPPTAPEHVAPPESIPFPPMEEQQPTVQPEVDEAHEPMLEEPENPAGTTAENQGVIIDAALIGEYRPPYPRISQRRGEEGTVVVSVKIMADGHVVQVDILQSSGYRRLDDAAVKGAYKMTFTPAHRDGQPIAATTQFSYTFAMSND